MEAGGAERVMAQLCNYFAEQKYDITLLTLSTPTNASFYNLHDGVKWEELTYQPPRFRFGRFARVSARIAALRKKIVSLHPDLIISFVDITNIMALLATIGLSLPIIVSERIDPAAHRLSRVDRILRWFIYPRASRIVVQTPRAAQFFKHHLSSKTVIIPNPVPKQSSIARPDQPSPAGRFRIIGIGRLDRQKGFDILIDSFADLAVGFPNWDVVIFGQGPDQSALLEQIKARGLEGRIQLLGISTDIATEIARSHFMAFPSRYEGFPNALAEAMAGGLPVAAFKNVSGVEDLVISGESGILADPDRSPSPAKSFAEELAQLMTSAELRCEMGRAAKVRADIFAPETIFWQWDKLITTVRHR